MWPNSGHSVKQVQTSDLNSWRDEQGKLMICIFLGVINFSVTQMAERKPTGS